MQDMSPVRITNLRPKRISDLGKGTVQNRTKSEIFFVETVGPACCFVSPHGGLEELHRRSGVGEETSVCAKGWLADGEQGDERYRCDTHTCTGHRVSKAEPGFRNSTKHRVYPPGVLDVTLIPKVSQARQDISAPVRLSERHSVDRLQVAKARATQLGGDGSRLPLMTMSRECDSPPELIVDTRMEGR